LLKSGVRKKNFLFIPIPITKTTEIDVKLFLLIREAYIRGFFTLKLLRKTYMILVRFFCFRFWDGFLGFLGYE
jgi:hypothetical protein